MDKYEKMEQFINSGKAHYRCYDEFLELYEGKNVEVKFPDGSTEKVSLSKRYENGVKCYGVKIDIRGLEIWVDIKRLEINIGLQ